MAPSGSLNVTAVIVNWRSPEETIRSIASLADAFSMNLRIIIVENGSRDDSVEHLRTYIQSNALDKYVTLLISDENLGFCGGVNLGVDRALAQDPPPDYIWTLNPDAIVSPETVRELVAVAAESGAGIVSAPEGGPGIAGFGGWPKPFFLRVEDFRVIAPRGQRWIETGRSAAWSSLYPVAVVKALIEQDSHFQDPDLFMDWDEWDCSIRVQRLGFRVVAALRAAATHDTAGRALGNSPIAATRRYYQSRNAIIVARRVMPWWQFWPCLPIRFARDFSWFARLRLRGKRPNERAYIVGAVDAFRGRSGRWKHHPATPTASR